MQMLKSFEWKFVPGGPFLRRTLIYLVLSGLGWSTCRYLGSWTRSALGPHSMHAHPEHDKRAAEHTLTPHAIAYDLGHTSIMCLIK